MIKKLLVLNGTEGHKFEVGKQYINTDDVLIVKEIERLDDDACIVYFNDGSRIDVVTKNILVFY